MSARAITARPVQVFPDGFMREPPTVARVRAARPRRPQRAPITQCWPRSDRQRCSVHCPRNLYSKLPERERERVKLAYWRVLDDTIDEADAKEKLQAPVDKPALSALACRPPRSRCVPPDGRQFPGLGLRRLAPVREWAPCCALRGHGAERLRTSWMRWTNGRPPPRARIIPYEWDV